MSPCGKNKSLNFQWRRKEAFKLLMRSYLILLLQMWAECDFVSHYKNVITFEKGNGGAEKRNTQL